MQSDKKIKTLTDTAELIEDAVRSIFVPNELFVHDFLKQSVDFLIVSQLPPRAGERSDDGAELGDVELDPEVEPQQQDQEAHQQEQGEAKWQEEACESKKEHK